MHPDTLKYNASLGATEQKICDLLAKEIDRGLPEAENKVWHAHPVWFLDGNPVVGYSKLKDAVRLLFWSGQSFDEEGLKKEGSFKAARPAPRKRATPPRTRSRPRTCGAGSRRRARSSGTTRTSFVARESSSD